MPEQFPYPTEGWSTGKMRKKGDRMRRGSEGDVGDAARNFENSPLIDSIAKQHQERMKAQGIPEQMKQYLPRSGVGQAEVRELEGLRKEKTQHLSESGEYQVAGGSAGRDMPLGLTDDKATGQRRLQLRREIEGNFQSKISPDEYDLFKEEMNRFNNMAPEDRKKVRRERQMEEDAYKEQNMRGQTGPEFQGEMDTRDLRRK